MISFKMKSYCVKDKKSKQIALNQVVIKQQKMED